MIQVRRTTALRAFMSHHSIGYDHIPYGMVTYLPYHHTPVHTTPVLPNVFP